MKSVDDWRRYKHGDPIPGMITSSKQKDKPLRNIGEQQFLELLEDVVGRADGLREREAPRAADVVVG